MKELTIQQNKIKETCNALNLPTQNRSVLLYYLAEQILTTPTENKEELLSLLFTLLADDGTLFCLFENKDMEEKETFEHLDFICKRKKLMEEHYQKQKELSMRWKQLLSSEKKLPVLSGKAETNTAVFSEESEFLYNAFQKYVAKPQQKTEELRNNLRRLVEMNKQTRYCRKIAPMFFYQIMTKHANRLASNEEFMPALSTLWNFKEYNISQNNEKNFFVYQNYGKLFRKLCKFYCKNEEIDWHLCLYGFYKCSNLTEWFATWQPKKLQKMTTPFLYDIYNANTSCVENNVPKMYLPETLFHCTTKKQVKFYNEHEKILEAFLPLAQEYILDHAECLIHFMENLYQNENCIKDVVEQIFSYCNENIGFELTEYANVMRLEIFDSLVLLLDKGVQEKVFHALKI